MIIKTCATFKIMLILALFLTQINSRANANTTPTTWIVAKDGSGDFKTIQEAIANESVSAGDIIFVRNGTYAENIVINKSISLVGENPDLTVISGDFTTSVVYIKADYVNITNFTVTKSGTGPINSAIYIDDSNEVMICGNRIINNTNGIIFYSSAYNLILRNIIENNSFVGILFLSSHNNFIADNIIARNRNGITFYFSNGNSISGNTILDSIEEGVFLYSSDGNIIYNNNFQNIRQVWNSGVNYWNYDGEGNYWSDYNGSDFYGGFYKNETGCDGIGDEPYVIDENNRDDFPLMGMFSPYEVYFKNEKYRFTLISNSTVSNFSFELGVETGNKVVRFNVAGEDGSVGFCRVSIPTGLMNYSLIVLVDYEEVTPALLSSTGEAYARIYFIYTHSVHNIAIISSKTLNLYDALLAELIQLQEKLGSLNVSYYELLNNLSSLLDSYVQLQGSYTDLYELYQKLLQRYNENLQNLQNLTYAFLTAITLFIIITVYLSKRAHSARPSRVKLDENQAV
jgi:parallel beta-helix repeat protein